MSDIPIINDTPYSNKFTLLCCGAAVLWVGAIVYKNTYGQTPAHEHSQNKRYMVKQQSKLNREITHLNRNNKSPFNKPGNFSGRHRRFNKSR